MKATNRAGVKRTSRCWSHIRMRVYTGDRPWPGKRNRAVQRTRARAAAAGSTRTAACTRRSNRDRDVCGRSSFTCCFLARHRRSWRSRSRHVMAPAARRRLEVRLLVGHLRTSNTTLSTIGTGTPIPLPVTGMTARPRPAPLRLAAQHRPTGSTTSQPIGTGASDRARATGTTVRRRR